MLFSLPSFKRYFVYSAWLSIDGTNTPRPPLSLGRKRVSGAIGSGFLLLCKNLKMILFSEHPVAALYFENCLKMKGMSKKLVDMKLVSSAYWDSFRFSFLPGRLKPLFSSLFTLFVNTSFWVQYSGKESGHPCLTPLSNVMHSEKYPLFCTCDYVSLYIILINSIYCLG